MRASGLELNSLILRMRDQGVFSVGVLRMGSAGQLQYFLLPLNVKSWLTVVPKSRLKTTSARDHVMGSQLTCICITKKI